jgi:hypothetical protein
MRKLIPFIGAAIVILCAAARAYDRAAARAWGEFAFLNFPSGAR